MRKDGRERGSFDREKREKRTAKKTRKKKTKNRKRYLVDHLPQRPRRRRPGHLHDEPCIPAPVHPQRLHQPLVGAPSGVEDDGGVRDEAVDPGGVDGLGRERQRRERGRGREQRFPPVWWLLPLLLSSQDGIEEQVQRQASPPPLSQSLLPLQLMSPRRPRPARQRA